MRRVFLFLAIAAGVVLLAGGVAKAATCEINGGAKWTNNSLVSVTYDPGGNTEYRISNTNLFWDSMSSAWLPVSGSLTTTWDISGGYDGYDCTYTVYMEFRSSPSDTPHDQCEASILLDTEPPYVTAYPVTVRRGHVCRLAFWATDRWSPKCRVTLWITDKRGRTKKKFVDDFQKVTMDTRSWRYRCTLKRGTYHINVSCEDLAGNVSPHGHSARLHVN